MKINPNHYVPPQATDLEEVILGAILIEKDAINRVTSVLEPYHFYKPENSLIFEEIINMNFDGVQIDILTVTQRLKKKGKLDQAGGMYYIATLTNRVVSSSNIESHSLILLEKYALRELITLSIETIDKSVKQNDVFDISDELMRRLDKIFNFIDNKATKTALEVLDSIRKMRRENKNDGLMTGFEKFDSLTNGLKKGNLVVLGARPGMGKTSFALQMAKQVAEQNKSTLFFSLEMMSEEVIKRLESQISGINNKKIETDNLNPFELEQLAIAHKKIRQLSLHIDDTAGLSVPKMKLKAQRVKQKYGLDLIVVDYLQLCTNDKAHNREGEISSISRGLKQLAKDLECPVIALSQLSRALETRSDKRPMLSDLRESGAIEQDADMVTFLYRPKYYDKGLPEDIVEFIISKNRHGSLETINFEFIDYLTIFNATNKSVQDIISGNTRTFDAF
jgi:replicative DNA helicase